MQKIFLTLVMGASFILSGCSTSGGGMSSGNNTPGSYCYEHTTVCVVGGVIVAGAVAAIIIHNNEDDNSPPPSPSDQRLKRDIKPLTVTENGIKIYSFRYLGDDQLFSGVIAQDLLQDPETAQAVSQDENGYYAVDYAALGLPVINEDAMLEAGRNAEKIAMGQAYQE